MDLEESEFMEENEVTNGASGGISHYVITVLELYGLSFLQQCISIAYAIYLRLTFFNLVIFCLKYVPTVVYMYNLIKNIIITSRERLKKKQMELEDIQLQIQIVNTKLCVRDAEFNERAELLRREMERLRRVRARVRDVIAGDDALRRVLGAAADCDSDLDVHLHSTPQEESELIMEMLKGLKSDHFGPPSPERNFEKMDCGEHAESNPSMDQASLYSSLSDMDVRQDCRVKIVKVTNVYKIAYLKHYIKQKRLRRANKRAALKKKVEITKNQLEEWQKALNNVINSIATHPRSRVDLASQEAMGDYSKPHEFSDSDSDVRNNDIMYYDENTWEQNQYRPYPYNDDIQDPMSRDFYEPQDNGDMKYSPHKQCEREMKAIIEETGSQIAIEEITSEADDGDYRDLVAI